MSYARELAALRRLSHASPLPGLVTATDRISAAGGTWRVAGENLATVGGDGSSVAARTISMWLDSPGHRRNLLDPVYTHTGAGVVRDLEGVWWIVQLYSVPR